MRAGHSSACCKTCSHAPEGLLKERALPACVHSVNGQKPHRQTDSQHTHANRASCDEGEEASGRRGQRQEAHDQLSGVKTESRAVMRTGPGAPGMSAPSRPPAQSPGVTSLLAEPDPQKDGAHYRPPGHQCPVTHFISPQQLLFFSSLLYLTPSKDSL